MLPSDHLACRLILLRHADSQQASNVKDHDRPITQQGREAACKVAALLQSRGWLPDLVICSNALRTKQTLEAMQLASPDFASKQHKYFASLYTVAALDGQTRRHIAECITSAVADSVACVMCVGHNKGWEEAATSLAVRQFLYWCVCCYHIVQGKPVRLTTASAALFEAEQESWQDALDESTQWQLVDVLVPS